MKRCQRNESQWKSSGKRGREWGKDVAGEAREVTEVAWGTKASQALMCKQITWTIWIKCNFRSSWWGLHSASLTRSHVVVMLAGGAHHT